MPGLGSTGGKFQLSAGWRFAAADRSYFNSQFNRDFTELWGPKIRLSVLDLTALYRVNKRIRITGTVPIVFNKFSMILPPFGIDQGSRHGFPINGLGDVTLYGQSFLFDPEKHPFQNISLGIGIKPPTGSWDARRTLPNQAGNTFISRSAYPPAMLPGDGGTGILFGYDAYKVLRGMHMFRGTTLFSSAIYLANPRVTNSAPSIIQSLGVPLNPIFLSRLNNSVADTWTLRAGFSTKVPGTWDKPLLRGLRLRGTLHWDGLRGRDIFGSNRGFRQPGWALAVAPGFSYRYKRHMLILEVPITIGRHINPGQSALPGLPRRLPDARVVPGAFNPKRQLGLVAPASISIRYVRTM